MGLSGRQVGVRPLRNDETISQWGGERGGHMSGQRMMTMICLSQMTWTHTITIRLSPVLLQNVTQTHMVCTHLVQTSTLGPLWTLFHLVIYFLKLLLCYYSKLGLCPQLRFTQKFSEQHHNTNILPSASKDYCWLWLQCKYYCLLKYFLLEVEY